MFLTRGTHSLFLWVANGEPHNLLSPLQEGLVGAAILPTDSIIKSFRASNSDEGTVFESLSRVA